MCPAVAALSVAVAPHNAHAEGGGGIGIPGVRGLEGDGARRYTKPIDDALVHTGMWLEHADLLDGYHVIEQILQLGAGNGVRQHGRRAIGQDRGREARSLEARKHARHLRVNRPAPDTSIGAET